MLRPTSAPRLRWGAVLALVLTLGAAACGSPAPSTAPGAASDAPSAAAPAVAYPVSIAHKYGSTEIAAEPQRVVLVGLNEQDAMLALGEDPVAVSNFLDAPDGDLPVGRGGTGQRAAPGAARPDRRHPLREGRRAEPGPDHRPLRGPDQEQYTTLSQIAPTVAQPGENFSISWQDTTLTLGKIFGKEAEAQKVLDDTEARFAQERAAHPEFAGKSAVTATFYEGYYVYGADDPRGRLMTSLGFTIPPDIAQFINADGFGGNVPAERAAVLDVDTLVWVAPDTLPAQLEADPVYSRLDVATQGRAVFLNENDDLGKAFTFVTPLSIPFLLDGLVPKLAPAVDGDPATGM